MTTTESTPYPTLAHAFAALDSLPIVGSVQATAEAPGVDYDALDRARQLLPHVWSDGAALERIGMTLQGGVILSWQRPGARLIVTMDPLSLYTCRLESKSESVDWTRATLEQVVGDIRAALGLPAMPAGWTAPSNTRMPQKGSPRPVIE